MWNSGKGVKVQEENGWGGLSSAGSGIQRSAVDAGRGGHSLVEGATVTVAVFKLAANLGGVAVGRLNMPTSFAPRGK